MFRRTFILLFILHLSIFQILAKTVGLSDAIQIATNFHKERFPSKLRSEVTLQLVYQGNSVGLRSVTSNPPLYIYNFGENQGFVIVSGEDAGKTILGYADEGRFCIDAMPENVRNWLNFYQEEIERFRSTSTSDNASNASAERTSSIASSTAVIAPLLGTIKFNQTEPFNLSCPWDAASQNRTLAGCVAVAMAQIMKYYQWPVIGKGSHSYIDANYGLQSIDFSKTSYDWNNILGTYESSATSVQKTAVSTLMYHCGVAVDMAYSLTGSSATINKAASALVNYFGYDSEIQQYERLYYSESNWNALIKKELDNARPVFFSASSDDGGHAFVCDGYDSNELFHINWGWGGFSNGYFELSALASDYPGITGATGGYTDHQCILAGIHKSDAVNKTSYQILTYQSGLTSSINTISNVRTKTFNATLGLINAGTNNFTGKWGIGYLSGNTMTVLKESSTFTLLPSSGYSSYTLSSIVAPSKAGTYILQALYKSSDSTVWSIMKGTYSLNNSLILKVSSNYSATLQKPNNPIELTLSNVLMTTSRFYQNKSVNVDVTVKNTGPEFFSNLGLCLISATNPTNRSYICERNVCCPAGETKTFHLTGTVTSPPGNYYLQAQFDSTDSNSNMDYKTLSPSNFNSISLEVHPQSGPPILQLNNSLYLANGDPFSKNDTVNLTANITNIGGYFFSNITAFVFSKSGGSSLTSLTAQHLSIDSLETKEVKLTGILDLVDGDYSFSLYQLIGNGWYGISPTNFAQLDFSIAEVSSANHEMMQTKPLFIYQVGDRLQVETNLSIKQLKLFDMSGRLIRTNASEKSLMVGDLAPGIYLVHILSNNISYTERFIKY